MSSNGKQILLTGGAGFIGSHVAEALLRRGKQLTIIDNLDSFYSSDWKKANLADVRRIGPFEFHAVDICDLERLREIIARTRPDAIVHLAARAGVRPSCGRVPFGLAGVGRAARTKPLWDGRG